MKKTVAFFCVCMAVLMVSCGDKSPTGGGALPTEADLVGKWMFNSVYSVGTVRIQLPPYFDSTANVDSTSTCTGGDDWADLKSDKSYQLSVNDPVLGHKTETGTWVLSGSTLTMISTGNTDTTTLAVAISGTAGSFTKPVTNTVTSPGLGMTYTYNLSTTIYATKQ